VKRKGTLPLLESLDATPGIEIPSIA